MRHVREMLRLKFVGGVPIREIARRIGVAASTVRATIRRFQAAGLSWPLPEEMTDAVLEAKLFADAGTKQGHRRQVEPDWASIHRELKRKHVTLAILWDEYVATALLPHVRSGYVAGDAICVLRGAARSVLCGWEEHQHRLPFRRGPWRAVSSARYRMSAPQSRHHRCKHHPGRSGGKERNPHHPDHHDCTRRPCRNWAR